MDSNYMDRYLNWVESTTPEERLRAIRLYAEAGGAVIEHAQLMSGGDYHVWNTEPHLEEVYPLEKRIEAGQRHGGKVYRRKIIVVEDWRIVPKRRKQEGAG